MKIAHNHMPPVMSEAYLKNVEKKATASPSMSRPENSDPATTDRVELSDRAKELQLARKILASAPDVRSEKIAMLKKQLGNGTYQMDAQKIASGMMREALENDRLSRSSG